MYLYGVFIKVLVMLNVGERGYLNCLRFCVVVSGEDFIVVDIERCVNVVVV